MLYNHFHLQLKQDTGQLRVMYREGPKGTPFHTLLAEGFIYSPLTSGNDKNNLRFHVSHLVNLL